MGKDEIYRGQYDPLAALTGAGRLLGMELSPCGENRLCGPYYLSGEPHPWRKDKLKVFISRGSVWVAEEGGRCISLPQWMIEFGHAADWREAIRMIKSGSGVYVWDGVRRHGAVAADVRYVEPAALRGASAYDLNGCALFRWMCGMFPEEKVREAWRKYNVTTDSHGNCVYWYMDQNGRILYDKRILYKADGHRDKSYFPGRQYRIADGYTGRCYFGANLEPDGRRAFIVESEKSAILGYLFYQRRFLATGGKGNLREIDSDMLLLPDMDARREWEEKGEVWPWWMMWPEGEAVPDHADIGDLIERRMK